MKEIVKPRPPQIASTKLPVRHPARVWLAQTARLCRMRARVWIAAETRGISGVEDGRGCAGGCRSGRHAVQESSEDCRVVGAALHEGRTMGGRQPTTTIARGGPPGQTPQLQIASHPQSYPYWAQRQSNIGRNAPMAKGRRASTGPSRCPPRGLPCPRRRAGRSRVARSIRGRSIDTCSITSASCRTARRAPAGAGRLNRMIGSMPASTGVAGDALPLAKTGHLIVPEP